MIGMPRTPLTMRRLPPAECTAGADRPRAMHASGFEFHRRLAYQAVAGTVLGAALSGQTVGTAPNLYYIVTRAPVRPREIESECTIPARGHVSNVDAAIEAVLDSINVNETM